MTPKTSSPPHLEHRLDVLGHRSQVGDQAYGLPPPPATEARCQGQVERPGIERAEPLADEHRLQPPGAPRPHLDQAQGQASAAWKRSPPPSASGVRTAPDARLADAEVGDEPESGRC